MCEVCTKPGCVVVMSKQAALSSGNRDDQGGSEARNMDRAGIDNASQVQLANLAMPYTRPGCTLQTRRH